MTNDDPDLTSGDQPSEPPAARSDKEQVLDHLDKLLGRSPSGRRWGRPQSTTLSSAAARDDEPATDAGEPSLASIPMFAATASWTSPDADADDDVPTIDSAGGPDRGWIAEDSQIDWQLVRKLKLASVDRLDEQIKQHRARHDGHEPSVADRREMGKPIIAHIVTAHAEANAGQGYLWTPALEDRYFKAVFDSQFGYGRAAGSGAGRLASITTSVVDAGIALGMTTVSCRAASSPRLSRAGGRNAYATSRR